MPYKIPGDSRRWSVVKASDMFGQIIDTRGIDFDDEGYATLAKKANVLYTNSDDANFLDIVAFVADANDVLIQTTDGTFILDVSTGGISEHTTTSEPTIFRGSDAVAWQGRKYVSGTQEVKYTTGSSWSNGVTSGNLTLASDTTFPRPLCINENRNELVVGDDNLIKAFDTSHTLQVTCTLPSDFIVVWARWRNNKIYIGTKNRSGSQARMFIWDGVSTSADQGYSVNAAWIYSAAEFLGSMWVVTSAGQILRFNGGGFDEPRSVGLPDSNFPIYYTDRSWLTGQNLIGKVAQRGMIADGETLLLMVDGTAEQNSTEPPGELVEYFPSGFYVYDPQVGLYMKHGCANKKYQTITVSSRSSNTLTLASPHEAQTGDSCVVNVANVGITLIGINDLQTCYVIRVSDTQIKLAATRADAHDGNELTLTGTPSGDTILFDSRESISATYDFSFPGAVTTLPNEDSLQGFYGSRYLWGTRVKDIDGSTDVYTLQSPGLGRNVGSFVTSRLNSLGISDSFYKVIVRFSGVYTDEDKIVVKARTDKRFGIPTIGRILNGGLAVWASDQVISTDYALKPTNQVQVGDEVSIISGAGAGRSAHISSITDETTELVYTLDESIEGISSSQKSEVQFDNWEKLGTITNNDTQGYKEFVISDSEGTFAQVKLELRGFGVRIEDIIVVNSPAKLIE